VVKVDDRIQVAIKDIDPIQRRISLTMKSKDDDPWLNSDTRFAPGQSMAGTVQRLKGFGAIIEIAPGIEGMLPITALKQKFGEGYRKQASPGKSLEVKVAQFDAASRRILLTLPDLDQDDAVRQDYEEYLKSEGRAPEPTKSKTGESSKPMGSFGALLQKSLDKFQKGDH
jgi:small subunit ribosomal protein S1